ncbi:MAG: TatD family hydrolase, partial [Oceanisphaera sp.]|nr:TatD family hydrolase [Oceanisphaera sp.]
MSKKRREIPVFDHPIIETHCHLDYLKDRPLEETLEQAKGVNIEKVITIAVSPDNLARVRELSQVAPWVYGTQGIHPHDAESYSDDVEAEIRALQRKVFPGGDGRFFEPEITQQNTAGGAAAGQPASSAVTD